MSLWWMPLVGIPGYLVFRAWQHDAALRSGELMDVRDVLPRGEAEIELRALGERPYRLELQFEASVEEPLDVAVADAGDATPSALRYRLCVERSDGAILYERERDLTELFGMAAQARESIGPARDARTQTRHWGSLPLLDFQSPSLGRLRFEFSVETRDGYARLEKAHLVLKEDVRRLRYSAALLDRIALDAEAPRSPL